jgi:hypothetical protein
MLGSARRRQQSNDHPVWRHGQTVASVDPLDNRTPMIDSTVLKRLLIVIGMHSVQKLCGLDHRRFFSFFSRAVNFPRRSLPPNFG